LIRRALSNDKKEEAGSPCISSSSLPKTINKRKAGITYTGSSPVTRRWRLCYCRMGRQLTASAVGSPVFGFFVGGRFPKHVEVHPIKIRRARVAEATFGYLQLRE
jgi:hypothetical protein